VGLLVVVAAAALWLARRGETPPPPARQQDPSPAATQSPVDTSETAKSDADFEAIYRELEATRRRAYQDYRPELLDDVYGPDCSERCDVERAKTVVQDMAAAGARFSDHWPRILEVEVITDFQGAILENGPRRLITIRVVDEQEPSHVINRDGSQGASDPGWPPKRRVLDLYFSPSRGRWLIADHRVEGLVGDFPPSETQGDR
jgi:hypothetical protein